MGIVVRLQFKECTKWLCNPPPPSSYIPLILCEGPFFYTTLNADVVAYESGDQTVRYNSCWWCCRIYWNTRRRWGFYKSRPWTACRRNYKWTTAILWGSWWSPSVPKWVGGESVHYTYRQYTDRHRQTDRQVTICTKRGGWRQYYKYKTIHRQTGHHLYQKGWVGSQYTTHIDNNTQTQTDRHVTICTKMGGWGVSTHIDNTQTDTDKWTHRQTYKNYKIAICIKMGGWSQDTSMHS